jgi:hypothetical protein
VAKLVARLLVTASSLGSNPDIPPIGNISKGLANKKYIKKDKRLFYSAQHRYNFTDEP